MNEDTHETHGCDIEVVKVGIAELTRLLEQARAEAAAPEAEAAS